MAASLAAPEPYVRIFGEIPRALRARSAVALVIAAFKTCPLGQRGGMRIERLEDRSPRPIRARGPCTTARTRCLAARQSRPATAEGWPGSGGRARLEHGPGARQPRAPPCLKPVRAASGRRRPTQSENYSTYIKASSAPAPAAPSRRALMKVDEDVGPLSGLHGATGVRRTSLSIGFQI
jgi:hypothetical protein